MGLDIRRYHMMPVEERQINGIEKNNNNLAYLRSNYNDIGFNPICRENDLPSMYDIFEAAIESGKPGVDWYITIDRDQIPQALLLANETKNGLEANPKVDRYHVDTAKIIIAMLEEMYHTGYGLVLSWSL